jgi:hypothetical protein
LDIANHPKGLEGVGVRSKLVSKTRANLNPGASIYNYWETVEGSGSLFDFTDDLGGDRCEFFDEFYGEKDSTKWEDRRINTGLDCSCDADVWSDYIYDFEDNFVDCAQDVTERQKVLTDFPTSDYLVVQDAYELSADDVLIGKTIEIKMMTSTTSTTSTTVTTSTTTFVERRRKL